MSPRQCGLFVNLADDNGTQRRAPLKSINVSATSCGPIAHNTIKFQYKNTNDTAIQSKFIFPVNSQSCVYHLSANVAGRIIIGKVKEKEEAQKEYDQAIESGKSAVLAKESKEASDIMELELGAFGSNEEAEVTVKEIFEMKLIKNGQHFQYKFPTSMFVRYGDSITAEASQNAPTEYVLNFNILSYAGVNKIIPKPWIGNETEGNTFTFTGNRKVFEKDHDVQLDMILSENFKGVKLTENLQDLTVLDQGDRKTDKMLTLSSFLVHVPTTPISELPAKEYVFVVDCSGSMGGQRIESARKTLQLLINSLPVGSYFNIVRFGSSYESLFRQPKEYTKENKDIAMKLAGTMGADLGGTEMHACLTSVLECKRHITNYKRQIFVLTDGDISNQNETLSLVKRNAKENRCFSFGIGSGCSTALVNGLADAGMGCASFITDKTAFEWEKQENLSSICVKSLMASASQHIAAVKIIPEPKAPKEPFSMVVDATCLNVFHEGHPEKVTLELTMANNQEEHVVSKQNMDDIETIESPFEPNVLHKLAAKKIIGDMVTSNLSNPYGLDMQKEIVDLSVKEQVLSPYTALVGVADESTIVGVSQRVDVGHVNDLPFQLSQINCIMKSNMSQCLQRDAKLCDLDMRADSLQSESLQMCSSSFNSLRRVNKRSLFGSLMNSVGSAFSKLMPANKSESDDSVLTCSMDVEPCGMAFESISSAWGDDAEEECASLSEDSEAVREYQDITNQQHPGGEWTFKVKSKHEENLLRNIEATFDDVVVQSTVYAILLLLVDFSATFDEWKLTAIKGVMFLKKNVNELESELVKLLSESKLEVDDDLLFQLLH